MTHELVVIAISLLAMVIGLNAIVISLKVERNLDKMLERTKKMLKELEQGDE